MLQCRNSHGRVHGQVRDIKSCSDHQVVRIAVGSGDEIELQDPDNHVDKSAVGTGRTLEVKCIQCKSIEISSSDSEGLYWNAEQIDVVGLYLNQSVKNQPKSLRLSVDYDLHQLTIALKIVTNTSNYATLSAEDHLEMTVAARGVQFEIQTCYYVPAFDPYVPRVYHETTFLHNQAEDEETTLIGLNFEDPVGTSRFKTPEQNELLLSEIDDSSIFLVALCEACLDLLAGESAAVSRGILNRNLQFTLLDNTHWLEHDTVRVSIADDGNREDACLVNLRALTIAAVNAALQFHSDNAQDAGDELRLSLLRNGVSYIESASEPDSELIVPRDPIEKYWGIMQGFTLAKIGTDRWQELEKWPQTDELQDWAELERNIESPGLIDAYHDPRSSES